MGRRTSRTSTRSAWCNQWRRRRAKQMRGKAILLLHGDLEELWQVDRDYNTWRANGLSIALQVVEGGEVGVGTRITARQLHLAMWSKSIGGGRI